METVCGQGKSLMAYILRDYMDFIVLVAPAKEINENTTCYNEKVCKKWIEWKQVGKKDRWIWSNSITSYKN